MVPVIETANTTGVITQSTHCSESDTAGAPMTIPARKKQVRPRRSRTPNSESRQDVMCTDVLQTSDAAPNPASRDACIAIAAYFLAEQRSFAPGHELDDWLTAEAQVGRRDASGTPTAMSMESGRQP
jgi:hypothetical protein